MPTLFDSAARGRILERLEQLTPTHTARWGKMNAAQMQVHLADQIRCAIGELSLKPQATPFRYPIIKQLIVYCLPWPKGAPTAPELANPKTGNWAQERAELQRLIAVASQRGTQGPWATHPAFGDLTGRAWGVLMWRHLDHHLRQFGI